MLSYGNAMEVILQAIQTRAGGETVGTTIRLPRDLRDEMKIQAIKAGRSLNTHVVMILHQAAEARNNANAAA
ncbi:MULTISPECIES: Arc family DNA-binding protein [Paracoccus]|uniref:Arc family DNA-binding protein n=1 Tax=Paracoccus TaxID=265 RepID=UPI0008697C08|nr:MULTISPECIES: Arc family DNA-binding protein [Paracoccus]ODT57926.1 MAG: hypothetical protein ABS73_15000 [Paracoccus sp. SCN 68-21]